MKFVPGSLFKKLWLTITASILITILYSFLLSYLFYEKLYVDQEEKSLLEEGNRLALDYKGGPLSDKLKKDIEWYNGKSESEVFVVNSPRELSACLPFDINYETLVGPEERDKLLAGEAVTKKGYEERFDRKIVAVLVPLLDGDRLEGIIYLYVPLARISELTHDFSLLWLMGGAAFIIIAVYLGFKMTGRLTKPLIDMKRAAENVSQGDYSTRVEIQSNDEVGQLASAFNHMSRSIEEEDERKRDFLADVSHELRTPISYIKGYSEALASGFIKKASEQDKYLKLINREASRMVQLVADLLDLSRIDAGQYRLEKHLFPLAQLIEDFSQKYVPTMEEKQITFQTSLDPDIIMNGDEARIEQILQNIMDNAIRYTDNGGVIRLSLSKHPYGCLLELTDTGIGIPPEDLSSITRRFYRVNKARSRSDGGTGLGLSITEKLVRLHGGRLEIESVMGKGTKVKVLFPVL
ncbi:sensor histidine kinase [Mesobacillus zeae]|uniref:histidine kinase n=1 Tax=Mesobacillus zeae TaxID=1917180 RepID=A0A398BCI1_9BACI|nr:ATP-binding protein [Mesobacillus zeae]RID85520.1 HAMP domain-containing protein [Mesobacillus zeae]